MIGDFHFLRPEWLLGPLAAAALAWIVSRRGDMRLRWQKTIAPHLLDHLLLDRRKVQRLRPVHMTIALIALGSIAAAGPTWQRERSPFLEEKAPLAIAIDLSPTMDATDITPSRLERAKLKVKDLVAARSGARTAIFAYAGTAHMVLPLTDDAALVATYVDSLATGIMPVSGKNTAEALDTVEKALASEPVPGTILFMTDGVEESAFDAFKRRRGRNDIMVLGIGTPEGGPVKQANGGYATDASGARLFASFDIAALRRLKSEAGIQLATITPDDSDVQWIVRRAQSHLTAAQTSGNNRWQDAGWWLVFPMALLSALWFRRGWTITWTTALLLAFTLSGMPRAEAAGAGGLADAFLTPDQQGRMAFERGDFAQAADRFTDPMWKGVAFYRAGNYAQAADAFAHLRTPESYYNAANALAHLGKLDEAVGSLNQALKQRPDWPEAKANLALLQDAIKKRDEAEQEGSEPAEPPDQVQFDERGKRGKSGTVDAAEQTAEMWMRTIQTTPAQLLARRFAIEARSEIPQEQAP